MKKFLMAVLAVLVLLPVTGAQAHSSGALSYKLRAIAQCESSNNPHAISANGIYRGLFQFDRQTWRSVGGYGDPARASRTEQYKRASILLARRGTAPWPICGRR